MVKLLLLRFQGNDNNRFVLYPQGRVIPPAVNLRSVAIVHLSVSKKRHFEVEVRLGIFELAASAQVWDLLTTRAISSCRRNSGHTHSSPRPLSAQSVSSIFGVSFARDGGRLLINQQTSGNQRRLPDMAALVRRNMSTKGKFESLSDADKRRLLAAAR
jgi:hypothetical protein